MSRSYRDRNLECKVYIGNLSESTSKPEVETKFSRYGKLKSTWVARNPPGFAFVEFEDPRDAEDAVRALDGTRICGTKVRVEMSHGRSRKTISRRSYTDSKSRRRRYRSYSRSRSRSYSKKRNDSYSRSRSRSRSRSPISRSRSRS